MEYEVKKHKLSELLHAYAKEDVCLAFSGGVDSSLLLVLAVKEAAEYHSRVYAVTFDTSLHPKADLEVAREVAHKTGAVHQILSVNELEDPAILENPADRCYRCKKLLYGKLKEFAAKKSIAVIMEGTNQDDLGVYRPGIRAVRELGILSPLAACGFTKEEVRRMAGEQGILVAERPSAPCLATRLPYGEKIRQSVLKSIEKGETYLRGMGFKDVRIRVHGDVVRLELNPEQFPAFFTWRKQIIEKLKSLGFHYLTLDMEGFRSGSMDEILEENPV